MPGTAENMTLLEVQQWAADRGMSFGDTCDYSVPLKVGAGIVTRHARENFEGQHAPDGSAWTPLKPATIAGRRLGPSDRKAIQIGNRAPYMNGRQKAAMGREIKAKALNLMAFNGMGSAEARGLARAHVERRWRNEEGHSIRSIASILGSRNVLMLRDTGELMGSVTGQGTGSGEHAETLTPNEIVFGSMLDRSEWHQEGTPTIPARPFIGITPAIADEVGREFAEFVGERLKQ